MGEMKVAGDLIQMNAHMEMSGAAVLLIVAGVIVVTVVAIAAMILAADIGWKGMTVLGVIAAMAIAAMIIGVEMPREKTIHACANGPVSLEQIAVRYDIVKVDGKELTLRVR